ncbi:PH domain-containing protein [Balamuthia mandrillaris]
MSSDGQAPFLVASPRRLTFSSPRQDASSPSNTGDRAQALSVIFEMVEKEIERTRKEVNDVLDRSKEEIRAYLESLKASPSPSGGTSPNLRRVTLSALSAHRTSSEEQLGDELEKRQGSATPPSFRRWNSPSTSSTPRSTAATKETKTPQEELQRNGDAATTPRNNGPALPQPATGVKTDWSNFGKKKIVLDFPREVDDGKAQEQGGSDSDGSSSSSGEDRKTIGKVLKKKIPHRRKKGSRSGSKKKKSASTSPVSSGTSPSTSSSGTSVQTANPLLTLRRSSTTSLQKNILAAPSSPKVKPADPSDSHTEQEQPDDLLSKDDAKASPSPSNSPGVAHRGTLSRTTPLRNIKSGETMLPSNNREHLSAGSQTLRGTTSISKAGNEGLRRQGSLDDLHIKSSPSDQHEKDAEGSCQADQQRTGRSKGGRKEKVLNIPSFAAPSAAASSPSCVSPTSDAPALSISSPKLGRSNSDSYTKVELVTMGVRKEPNHHGTIATGRKYGKSFGSAMTAFSRHHKPYFPAREVEKSSAYRQAWLEVTVIGDKKYFGDSWGEAKRTLRTGRKIRNKRCWCVLYPDRLLVYKSDTQTKESIIELFLSDITQLGYDESKYQFTEFVRAQTPIPFMISSTQRNNDNSLIFSSSDSIHHRQTLQPHQFIPLSSTLSSPFSQSAGAIPTLSSIAASSSPSPSSSSSSSASSFSAGAKTLLIFAKADTVAETAEWMLALDGLRTRNMPLNSFIDSSLQLFLCKSLYKDNFKGAHLKKGEDEWTYFADGSVKNVFMGEEQQQTNEQKPTQHHKTNLEYIWNGSEFLPKRGSPCFGFGRWNSVSLMWFYNPNSLSSSTAIVPSSSLNSEPQNSEDSNTYTKPTSSALGGESSYLQLVKQSHTSIYFNYFWDPAEKEYLNREDPRLDWKWTRHFLASKSNIEREWIVEGDAPQPLVMFMQLLHWAANGRPQSS